MKSASVVSKWKRLLVAALIALFVLATGSSYSTGVAYAEGSRDLYPSGASGFRSNIEYRTNFFGPNFLRRRTLLQVYAVPGEVVLMGSSAVGVGLGDVQLFSSDQVTGPIGNETVTGAADFSCVTDQPGQGQITTRAQELAGPDTVPAGGVPGGYTPCTFTVPGMGPADNIYYVAIWGPSGDSASSETTPSGRINLITGNALDFGLGQDTSVSAWDVTVRSALSSTTDINGRLFADYMSRLGAGVGFPLFSTLFSLTTDSYIYQVDLRQLDPFGFIVYSNAVGFLDSDGTPLYHDVVAVPNPPQSEFDQNQLNLLQGGVSLAEPTHHIFFNTPRPEVMQELNGSTAPINPQINQFVFDGVLAGNTTVVGAGGVFDLTVNVNGNFLMVISRDGVDFDPFNPLNRALDGFGSTVPQQIAWDGLDNAGNPFLVGTYPARIVLRGGEVHFPLLDVENSQAGGPTYLLTNPPGGICPPTFPAGCFTGFHDDRGYTTASGIDVGTPGVVLSGIGPPPVPNSDPITGFDTRSGDRAFGDGTEFFTFGDKKGLDLWSYYPTEAETPLIIVEGEVPPPPGTSEAPPGIPEPATVTLFGLGLAGLAGYARARLRRRQET